MPTIYTHAVVGLGLGKTCTSRPLRWPFWVLAGLLPMLPDADSFVNAPYGSLLGHRGVSHSLIFALALGLVAAAATYRPLGVGFGRLAAFFFVATASHGVLDCFTSGGFGIPLFWPLSAARFGPWGPIPVADVGFEWPDPRHSRAVRGELLYVWLPTMVLVTLAVAWRRWRAAPARTPGLP